MWVLVSFLLYVCGVFIVEIGLVIALIRYNYISINADFTIWDCVRKLPTQFYILAFASSFILNFMIFSVNDIITSLH
jgi:hypothetical protein